MIEHAVQALDRSFNKLIDTQSKGMSRGMLIEQMKKVRTRFRKKCRVAADKNVNFAARSNGRHAFEDFKNGFEFARTSLTVERMYCAFFDGASGSSFFWQEETLKKLEKILEEFTKELQQFEDLEKVSLVMES
jgi:hypothetical protein